MTRTHPLRYAAAMLGLAIALSACGTDDTDEGADTAVTEEATDGAEPAAVEIVGVDYAYQGVPDSVEVGTRLEFRNASTKEAHEMVLMRIADDEQRSLEELLALPEEESGQVAEFRGVALALPGEETTYPEGETVISEPGRYALLCFIPVGADPEVIRQALQEREAAGGGEGEEEEPPNFGDGPPHFTRGMTAEVTAS